MSVTYTSYFNHKHCLLVFICIILKWKLKKKILLSGEDPAIHIRDLTPREINFVLAQKLMLVSFLKIPVSGKRTWHFIF